MTIIKLSGLTTDLPPAFGGKFLLSDIQRELGDLKMIELPLIGGNSLLVSEKAQKERLKINKSASSILTGVGDVFGDVIYKNKEEEII